MVQRATVGSICIGIAVPKPPFVILSTVPTKFVLYTLAVETAGYSYKVPLRALYLSDNNLVGTLLSAAKNLVLYRDVALFL